MPSESTLRDLAPTGIGLIETLRWQPNAGFLRLDRHLARMARSATALGMTFSRETAERTLSNVEGSSALRIRLELSADGQIRLTTVPFVPLTEGTVWPVRIARTRLSSADPLLRHKTTRRSLYEAARAEFTNDQAAEVLLVNERGAICEGTITNLFLRRGPGPLETPALSCGLLPGILREELIGRGDAVETVVSADDLMSADEVFVGNSLRGLIAARLEQ